MVIKDDVVDEHCKRCCIIIYIYTLHAATCLNISY